MKGKETYQIDLIQIITLHNKATNDTRSISSLQGDFNFAEEDVVVRDNCFGQTARGHGELSARRTVSDGRSIRDGKFRAFSLCEVDRDCLAEGGVAGAC